MKRIQLRVILTVLGTLAAPAIVYAVVQSLNGVTGSTQTFVNDSTISILSSSSANTHTLKWNGNLPVSRGGTGNNSFTNSALIFSDGSSLASTASQGGDIGLFWNDGTATQSARLDLRAVRINTNDDIQIRTNAALNFTDDGGVSGLFLYAVTPDALTVAVPEEYIFDFSSISTERTLKMPDFSGTLTLTQESAASSSMSIGSSIKPGCIVMGDSDGSGVTYVTANNGVLTATTTKPSICQ